MTKNELKVEKLVNVRFLTKEQISWDSWYGIRYFINEDLSITGNGGAFGSNFLAEYKGVEIPDLSNEFLRGIINKIEKFNLSIYENKNQEILNEFDKL